MFLGGFLPHQNASSPLRLWSDQTWPRSQRHHPKTRQQHQRVPTISTDL
jgi:hypothetical protein